MRLRLYASALLAAAALAAPSSAHIITGNLYLTDDTFNRVYAINPDVWQLNTILDGAFTPGMDNLGSLNFPEISGLSGPIIMSNGSTSELLQVDEVEPLFFLSTAATAAQGIATPTTGNGIAVGPLGFVYVANTNGTIVKIAQDYSSFTTFADVADGIVQPEGIAFLANGNMVVANYGGGNIILVDENGGNVAGGSSSVFDTLPVGQEPVSITVRNNLDIYVRCESGDIYQYKDGSAASRVRLGDYDTTDGLGTVAISFDQTTLYTIRNGGQDIVVIDADTGASFVGMSLPSWALTSFGIVSNQHVPGAIWEWGGPTTGSGGFDPVLYGVGKAEIGGNVTVEVEDVLGGAPVLLVMGTKSTSSFVIGGQIYIDFAAPIYQFPAVASGSLPGEGTVTYPFAIPNDPVLVHVKAFFQAGALDLGSANGLFSLTNPMTMYFGA